MLGEMNTKYTLKNLTIFFKSKNSRIYIENSNKIDLANKLFDLGNMALAGIVFVQLLPNAQRDWRYICLGLLICIITYGFGFFIS